MKKIVILCGLLISSLSFAGNLETKLDSHTAQIGNLIHSEIEIYTLKHKELIIDRIGKLNRFKGQSCSIAYFLDKNGRVENVQFDTSINSLCEQINRTIWRIGRFPMPRSHNAITAMNQVGFRIVSNHQAQNEYVNQPSNPPIQERKKYESELDRIFSNLGNEVAVGHVDSEASRYTSIYTQLIEKNTKGMPKHKRFKCRVNIRLADDGSPNSATLLDGSDHKICQPLILEIKKIKDFPMPSEREVREKLSDFNLTFGSND